MSGGSGHNAWVVWLLALIVCSQVVCYADQKRNVYIQVQDSESGDMIPYVVLDEVVVIPKNERRHYSRRNNPAVDLLKNVLAHKEDNRQTSDSVGYQMYEKLTMSIDPFDFDMDKTSFRRSLKFLENYVDTLIQNDSQRPYLPISLREKISLTPTTMPAVEQRNLYAKTWAGFDKFFEHGSLDANINALFQPVDVRSNNMDMLLIQFVSPLSTVQANTFYHYYILDTVMVDQVECIDLGFVPVNCNMLAFAGHLYVVNDSSYAVRKCVMGVTSKINLNWISGLRITQDFAQQPNGKWENESMLMETNFAINRRMRHSIYARYLVQYEQQTDSNQLVVDADSVDNRSRRWWLVNRPTPLTWSEEVCDTMAHELHNTPSFKWMVRAANIIGEQYVPTSKDFTFENSYWDFGPLLSTVSYNGIEGWRVRVGGMTTAKAHPNIFFQTYVAYGFADRRPKGEAVLTYSFIKKKHYVNESLRNAISLSGQYDLEIPGPTSNKLLRDNILWSVEPHSWADPSRWNRKGMYVARGRLTYDREWQNRLGLTSYVEYERNEAAGELNYPTFQSANWNINLTYSPGKPIYNNRSKNKRITEFSKNYPDMSLTNQVGYIFENQTLYNQTELSVQYRQWMSSFGYLDMRLEGGVLVGWDMQNRSFTTVPTVKLFYPKSNQSLMLSQNGFNLMDKMEFAMDKYVSLFLSYHLNGLILNRIPYLNMLKLREVVSFEMVYGGLSDRYAAEQLNSLSPSMPYMEMTVGIENIFRLFRIDYVRRLSYTDGLGGWQKNGIKISMSINM